MLGFCRSGGCCAALLLRRGPGEDAKLRRDYASLDSRFSEEPRENLLVEEVSLPGNNLVHVTYSFMLACDIEYILNEIQNFLCAVVLSWAKVHSGQSVSRSSEIYSSLSCRCYH